MPRAARVVVPGMPHHVTQRGNRGCDVFLDDADRRAYLSFMKDYADRYGVKVLAYCLMSNHVHFVVIPSSSKSLGLTFRDTHQAYASRFNRKTGQSGHLWQGRYYSTVLDERHFWAAVRYVERNPVRAGLVEHAWDYLWSSAPAHCQMRVDPLIAIDQAELDHVGNWQQFLSAGDDDAERELRAKSRTGRPCGSEAFIRKLESLLGRTLLPRKPGPKPRNKT